MSWTQHTPGVWTTPTFPGVQLTTARLAAMPAFVRELPPKTINGRQNPAWVQWTAKYRAAAEAAIYGGRFAELVALNTIKAGGSAAAAVEQARQLATHSGQAAQFPQLVAMLAQAGYTAAAAALSTPGTAAASQLAPSGGTPQGPSASSAVPPAALIVVGALLLVIARRRRR